MQRIPSQFWKRRLWIAAGLLVVALGTLAWFHHRSRKPNLLLITLDTTRADHLGCYGYQSALTPCLDQLAREGICFEQALTNVPLTLPSHATMLTGLLPPEHGLHINAMGKLSSSIPTLPELFQSDGYRTGAFLAAFVLEHQFGLARGFDHYDDNFAGTGGSSEIPFFRRRRGAAVIDSALGWMEANRASWPWFRRPYFCWVHLYDPHHPCDEHRAEFDARFAGRAYDAEIAYADKQIKRLLDSLRASGELENTLIVVAGDHGEGLGEHLEAGHGLQLYQATLHVPLIFHWPNKFPEPRRITESVGLVDLSPTFVDVFGFQPRKPMTGRSLFPLLGGKSRDPIPVFSETYEAYYEFHSAPQQSLVSDGWKYVRSPEPELYRLADDPHELKNLAESEKIKRDDLAALLRDLTARMQKAKPESTVIDQKTIDALRALGYTGGNRQLPDDEVFTTRPDVKTMLLPYKLTTDALALRDKDPEAAERLFKEIAEKHPQLIPGRMHYAETLAQRAESMQNDILGRKAKFEEAVKICRGILQEELKYPKEERNWEAGLILAGALDRIGQPEESDKAYDETLKLQPQNLRVHMDWARKLFNRPDRRGDAAIHLEIVTGIDPLQSQAHLMLGDISFDQNKLDEALRRYQLAARHNPGLLSAFLQIATIHKGRKEWSAAVPPLEHVLKLSPQNETAMTMLEEVRRQQKGH